MTHPTPRETRILRGIAFMLLASSLFPVMNGLAQWLSQRYPSEQVIWARITGHLLIMLAVMLPRAGWRVFATRRPGLQVTRSLLQATSTSLYFVAIATVPLAKAASISFLSPFVIALLAWPILGERLKPLRMLAIAIAFAGVIVVIRPGGETFQLASLIILGNVACYSFYQVFTRMVSAVDRADTSALWSALVGAVATTALLPVFWTTPAGLGDALAFLALGALGAAGHWCVASALSHGPAAVIAPFQYWQIVGSVLMQLLLTGLWPDAATWLGAAIIVAAGVFMAVTEARGRGMQAPDRPGSGR
jgi:drug/metabolite transporter (DMT)-like permease